MGSNEDPLAGRLQALLEEKYAIERELARGGMATVYLARDIRHDRSVAIKLLQPELATAQTAERFLREIQIIAKLQHPHILTLIDSGAGEGLVYYVMPHVDGESLRERLLWDKYLPIPDAVTIAHEIADALAYAHGQGVIHRDIKPENILLSAGHALVADFGIARAVWDSSQAAVTSESLPLGTPAYMSPEQAGAEPVDHRTDIYSLGCLLFEMVTGRPPFVGQSVSAIMTQHIGTAPAQPSMLRAGVSADLEAVILKAMAKRPDERFDTAQDMAEALDVVTRETADEESETAAPTPPLLAATSRDAGERGRHVVATPGGRRDLSGRFYRGLIVAGIAGAVVLALLALTGRLWKHSAPAKDPNPTPAAVTAPHGVAVRPFEPAGTDANARDLAHDLAGAISAELGRQGAANVVAESVALAGVQKGWTPKTFGDSLGARFVIDGSVELDGDEEVVTVQLFDARDDSRRWAESFRIPAALAARAANGVARVAVASLIEKMND